MLPSPSALEAALAVVLAVAVGVLPGVVAASVAAVVRLVVVVDLVVAAAVGVAVVVSRVVVVAAALAVASVVGEQSLDRTYFFLRRLGDLGAFAGISVFFLCILTQLLLLGCRTVEYIQSPKHPLLEFKT